MPHCVVPENIHTPTTEGFLNWTPPPTPPLRKFHFSVILLFKKLGFWNPPPPWNFRQPSLGWAWIFPGTTQSWLARICFQALCICYMLLCPFWLVRMISLGLVLCRTLTFGLVANIKKYQLDSWTVQNMPISKFVKIRLLATWIKYLTSKLVGL